MIINKNTSNVLLVNSLAVFGTDALAIIKVAEFDTATLVATKTNSSTVTAGSFCFVAASQEDAVSIKALLADELKPLVWSDPLNATILSMTKPDTDPDYFLILGEQITARLGKCGKCGVQFVVWVDREGDVWSAGKTNTTDKHPKVEKLTTFTCDACNEPLLLRR